MRILFDQGVPVPLRSHLAGHSVETAYELGWSNLHNGDLLDAAENGGFEVVVTTDQSLQYSQNLASRSLAVVVLMSTSWPRIRNCLGDIVAAVSGAKRFDYVEVPIT